MGTPQTKKQRIEDAREAARSAREKRGRGQRRMRVLVPLFVSLAVIVIVAVVVTVIAVQPKPVAAGTAPKNMATFGVQFRSENGTIMPLPTPSRAAASGPADSTVAQTGAKYHIVEYLDLSCPTCRLFETNTAAYTDQLVANGTATLDLRPIAILDRSYNGTNYSTRVNTAGACIANFDLKRFHAFVATAYARQPEETSNGLTNAQIVDLAHDAGASSASVDSCIEKQSYSAWVNAVTDDALSKRSVGGTPTVFINGKPADLGQFDLPGYKAALAAAG